MDNFELYLTVVRSKASLKCIGTTEQRAIYGIIGGEVLDFWHKQSHLFPLDISYMPTINSNLGPVVKKTKNLLVPG